MAKVIKVKDSYFNYLMSLISSDEVNAAQEYYNLCLLFFETPFTVLNPMDENRSCDGADLRERWLDNIGVKDERIKLEYANDIALMPVSFLEVLVALSVRVDKDILAMPDKPFMASEFFWDMVNNLVKYGTFGNKYHKASDILTDEQWCVFVEDNMKAAIKKVLTRTYHEDGKGGLFPMNKPKTNQRKMDMWANCMQYVSEKY